MASFDEEIEEPETVYGRSTEEADAKAPVHHVDRWDAKNHGVTVVHHADDLDSSADAKHGGDNSVDLKCGVVAHPFTYRNSGSDEIKTYRSYDDKHHLVTHHNVDTGVTHFHKDGTFHTNYYF